MKLDEPESDTVSERQTETFNESVVNSRESAASVTTNQIIGNRRTQPFSLQLFGEIDYADGKTLSTKATCFPDPQPKPIIQLFHAPSDAQGCIHPSCLRILPKSSTATIMNIAYDTISEEEGKQCSKKTRSEDTNAASDRANTEIDHTNVQIRLSELFRRKPGQWKCYLCKLDNDPKVTKCVACETPKVSAAKDSSSLNPATKPAAPFAFLSSATSETGSHDSKVESAKPIDNSKNAAVTSYSDMDDSATKGKGAL